MVVIMCIRFIQLPSGLTLSTQHSMLTGLTLAQHGNTNVQHVSMHGKGQQHTDKFPLGQNPKKYSYQNRGVQGS